jgi:hypothetical protein
MAKIIENMIAISMKVDLYQFLKFEKRLLSNLIIEMYSGTHQKKLAINDNARFSLHMKKIDNKTRYMEIIVVGEIVRKTSLA